MVPIDTSRPPSPAPTELGSPAVSGFADRLRGAATAEALSDQLGAIARELGFSYHALVHHADLTRPPPRFMFLQNYPAHWVSTYASAGLYRYDPAQRLAGSRPASFAWTELCQLTTLSVSERKVLDEGRKAGLGEGFTVPLHAPGERAASCSFAIEVGQAFPAAALLTAELVAHVAFATLFDLLHPPREHVVPRLTLRQQECLTLMAQGKTDWEIGVILGLSEETVTDHLNSARRRLGVARRIQLALAAVSYGIIGFDEIVTWQFPLEGG